MPSSGVATARTRVDVTLHECGHTLVDGFYPISLIFETQHSEWLETIHHMSLGPVGAVQLVHDGLHLPRQASEAICDTFRTFRLPGRPFHRLLSTVLPLPFPRVFMCHQRISVLAV